MGQGRLSRGEWNGGEGSEGVAAGGKLTNDWQHCGPSGNLTEGMEENTVGKKMPGQRVLCKHLPPLREKNGFLPPIFRFPFAANTRARCPRSGNFLRVFRCQDAGTGDCA